MKKLSTILWGFKTAWNIDKKSLLFWFFFSAVLSTLPAIALKFNQKSLSIISAYINGHPFVYSDIVPAIIGLGLLMIAIALSARINNDLIYMMMYETYLVGMYELIMDNIQNIEMTDLLKKDINDAWSFSYLQAGSLIQFVSGFCSLSAQIIGIISLLIVSATMSTIIFFIALVYIIVVFILSFAFSSKTRASIQADFEEDRLIEYYEKNYNNLGMSKEIRVYENTNEIVKQWKHYVNRKNARESDRIRSSEIRDFISGLIFYLFFIVIILICMVNVSRGIMTPDIFLVLFTLCLNVYNATFGVAGSLYRFDRGLDSLEKQKHFFDISPIRPPQDDLKKASTPADEDTIFSIDHLTFSYSDTPTLSDICFEIKKGDVVALVGHNGSGKSTLIKLMLNMYKPTSGTIKFMGRTYDEYSKSFLRSKIGVFFQDFYLFHSSLGENVGVGAIEDMYDESKIIDAIKKGGAEKILSKLPHGLSTLLGKFMDQSGTELSGGEKQRVASARAHMSNREILIFDEPASMLDPIAELEQFNNIRNKLNNRTAILVSHRVGFARMADKIIMLKNGRIAEMGTHEDLMNQNGEYAHFFNEQAQWYNEDRLKSQTHD